jgi:sugar lactone lactonase YvrE
MLPAMHTPDQQIESEKQTKPTLLAGPLEYVFTGCIWSDGARLDPVVADHTMERHPEHRILEFDPATVKTRQYATGVEFVNGRTRDAGGAVGLSEPAGDGQPDT